MNSPKLINRKLFLSLTVTSTAAFLVGCGSDTSGPVTPSGGAGGAGPSGGAGGSTAGAGGAAAGAPGAGAGGSAAGAPGGGGGGSAAGSSGSGGASGGGAAGASGGTGGNGGSGGAPVTPMCGTLLRSVVTNNHGHVISITAADVTAGAVKTIDTKGTATHSHWIQFTAADFMTLSNGGTVRKLSCNDGHEHEFIVNCVGEAMPHGTSGLGSLCDSDKTCAESMSKLCTQPLTGV